MGEVDIAVVALISVSQARSFPEFGVPTEE